MQLGIIGGMDEASFISAKARGLAFIELCVNDQAEAYLDAVDDILTYKEKYTMPIASLGRWGENKIDESGNILPNELELEYRLIDMAQQLDCPVYVTGCNYQEGLSYYANISAAINYLTHLVNYGEQKGVKIATYNCRWNNFIHSDPTWSLIHGHIPALGIKYDTSHSIYAKGEDYLVETNKWAHRFYHVHIKGALMVEGRRVDDPPAGMDQTEWGAFMSILYRRGYDGTLSIEPHSRTWSGALGEKGIDFTIAFMKKYIF